MSFTSLSPRGVCPGGTLSSAIFFPNEFTLDFLARLIVTFGDGIMSKLLS